MTAVQFFVEKSKSSPLALLLTGALSIAVLAASARIQVPMIPVPITLQTAVVLLLPCLFGLRMALTILASYFAAGALGLPVFAMAAGSLPGPAYFLGTTGGYLMGFMAAILMVGAFMESNRHWNFTSLFALMFAGHMVILAFGALWLAYGFPLLGVEQAMIAGFAPFILGSVLKSGLAAAAAKYFDRRA